MAVRAHHLAREHGRVLDADGVAAEGTRAHTGPNSGSARTITRFFVPIFRSVKTRVTQKIDLGLERALEAVRRAWSVERIGRLRVNSSYMPGVNYIGDLALVHEHRRLALAHGELGAVLDLVALALEGARPYCRADRRATG
ncbi:MAG: hypothetical protein U1E17_06575 [Geminicoccaceae bacterium]